MDEYLKHPASATCVEALNRGEVIAYPTEAVWGLGCDPFNSHAVEKILTLKKRSAEKGLILVAATISQFHFILDGMPAKHYAQLEQSWPGPHTWLVPHHDRVERIVSGSHDTIALRVSAHPVVKALCELYGGPIVSTSANPQALPAARSLQQAQRYFGDEVFYSAGSVGENARPSLIKDLLTGQIIRA
ncbi:translation factor SUA5 [Alteromonadaceae bacterium Bs31]|nr:translation factor SUA5 [Alteromonadaceae bacterium Bs31]